jgi:hypothetical protein
MLVVAALNRPSNGYRAKIVNQGQRNIRTGTWQVRTMVVVEAGDRTSKGKTLMARLKARLFAFRAVYRDQTLRGSS